MPEDRVTVVIATRNRRDELLATLARLRAVPEQPAIIVVDNRSRDGTADAVREAFHDVTMIELAVNRGAAARNLGAVAAATPYVAFADDDSWWAPGALAQAARYLDHHPYLGLVAARVLVGPDARPDPLNQVMQASPLPAERPLPGPRVLGFLACAAVVRRAAFLAVGGFQEQFFIGAEEEIVALDLAAAGWDLAYAEDVVAHHHPSRHRDAPGRRILIARNRLWTAWLRRCGRGLLFASVPVLAEAVRDPAARRGVLQAVRGLAWVARRPLPRHVEAARRLLERPLR